LNDTNVARIRSSQHADWVLHQAVVATRRHLPVDLHLRRAMLQLNVQGIALQSVRVILSEAASLSHGHLTACQTCRFWRFSSLISTFGNEELADLLMRLSLAEGMHGAFSSSFPALICFSRSWHCSFAVPMPDATVETHPNNFIRFRAVGYRWLDRKVTQAESASSGEWVAAHDVLADQIYLPICAASQYGPKLLSRNSFSLALNLTVLILLYRLPENADTHRNAVPWAKLLANAIAANKTAWRKVAQSSDFENIASVPDRIALLNGHKGGGTFGG